MKTKFLTTFVLWLTIAVTGTGKEALSLPKRDVIALIDSTTSEVSSGDVGGTTVRSVPKRAPSSDYTYIYKGVKYTYITVNNYTHFFNTSVHTPKDYGWYPDDDGWYVNAEKAYITAASINEETVPDNGEVVIINDLVGFFTNHTHLGCIADHGFTGKSKVKRIYFQDCDAVAYKANSNPYFFIGHLAFANAPQLEKVDLMQYITSGDNHWEPMPLSAVKRIWNNMFEGSPNALIRVSSSTLNDYRNSSVWTAMKDRLISYEPSGYEINEYGVRYKCMLAQDGKTYLTNDDPQRNEIMKQLRLWNADYQSFNAGTLLAPSDNGATVYYTTVEGCDADYLKKNNGVARIYNDVGSYYNYKTIAIRSGAFAGSDDLKAIEFYQTNGHSSNSYSDLKICIENGALRNCSNLTELRLFYYVEDGENHWETLGPTDVIPGDNIFGIPDANETVGMSEEEVVAARPVINQDFRIIVSSDRYTEFINDPNWSLYAGYIKAADYSPSPKSDINKNGMLYAFATTSSGITDTDQVVYQYLSWWNVPLIIAEIAITIYTMGTFGAVEAGDAALFTEAKAAAEKVTELTVLAHSLQTNSVGKLRQVLLSLAGKKLESITTVCGINFSDYASSRAIEQAIGSLVESNILSTSGNLVSQAVIHGFTDRKVQYMAQQLWSIFYHTVTGKDGLAAFAKTMQEDLTKNIIQRAMYSYFKEAFTSYMKKSELGGALRSAVFPGMVDGSYQAFNALRGDVGSDRFREGMRANILSNIHQVGMVGGQLLTTPNKSLVYHSYLKQVSDTVQYANILCSPNKETRTVGIAKAAFQNKSQLKKVFFKENDGVNSTEMTGTVIAIPDSAFVGCTALETIDLRLRTSSNGTRALGPENFILCGDSILAGLDSTKVSIIIPNERKDDFLEDMMWKKYQRFFAYANAEDSVNYSDYGVDYSFAYKGATQLVEKVMGHKVEHLVAVGATQDNFLSENGGHMAFFNDIGVWNNYKLDYVKQNAYRGNSIVKGVTFWDVKGWGPFGKTYLDFNITLQDSCFADNPELKEVTLLYLRTAGRGQAELLNPSSWELGANYPELLTPDRVKLGKGVIAGCPNLQLKMTERQMKWFEADTAWAKYKDKFFPCLFYISDKAVKSALSDLRFYAVAAKVAPKDDGWMEGAVNWMASSLWWPIYDATQLKAKGFSWLNGRLANNDKIQEFPEFKCFETVGLDYIGGSWFVGDRNLRNIELPSTIKSIGGYAFQYCDLREIEIPAGVTKIGESAFENNSQLTVVRCLGTTPAKLEGDSRTTFGWWDTSGTGGPRTQLPQGFRIYVPAAAVNDYKQAWSQYADYIVSDTELPVIHHVKTTDVGQLAEKLGLQTIMDGNYLMGLAGNYQKYDSLVVEGPLNGIDIGVLRFMAGADVNNSDPTNGRLRYLNLYGAELKQDKVHPYQCHGANDFIDADNQTGDYMFYFCDQLETVILPQSVTYIQESCFEHATNLKKLVVGDKTTGYDDEITRYISGLDELVFLTEKGAHSDAWGGLMNYDSWEVPINAVYVPYSQVGYYMNEPALTQYANTITAPFKDDEALHAFARKGHFFPSEYSRLNNINGILEGSSVRTFDELRNFQNITDLGSSLANCTSLQRVSLPDSLKSIGYEAFRQCVSLDSIYIYTDSIPSLESGAFRDLPSSFKIFVPHKLAKHYRTVWAEYADHIVSDDSRYSDEIIEITTTNYGQVAEKLGLTVERKLYSDGETKYVRGVYGNFSHIQRLKINGPISGEDFVVLRFLAGYSGWKDARNITAPLYELDLYDAQVVKSSAIIAEDRWFATDDKVKENDVLPPFALRRAYNLKTLILPKTLKKIDTRSLMECEALETVVIGDDIETINWSAFDDDASLTRMYLLAEKKPKMDVDNFLWRNLCNNYNPTFDAFYVRPSLYKEYIRDDAYVGSSWQRTNNISTGMFSNDDSFLAFASHAAATIDDMRRITSVDGWFKGNTSVTDLTPLRYTLIKALHTQDMQPLTQLERIAMPMTLTEIDDESFSKAKTLRYVDLQESNSPELINSLKNGGLQRIGLTERTLVYVPTQYGETDEVNVAVGDSIANFSAKTVRLYDGEDYVMPYGISAEKVENTRTLTRSEVPYTVCLPYSIDIPEGVVVYRLKNLQSNELVFTETDKTIMEAGQPYLVRSTGDINLNADKQTELKADNKIGTDQQSVTGYTLRGTFKVIGNKEANELGAYVLQSDGKWHAVLTDTDEYRSAHVPAYRCYLLQNREPGAKSINMVLDDSTTGIDRIRTIDTDGTERVYDLNGHLIQSNAKGIVIKNGKKVLIK